MTQQVTDSMGTSGLRRSVIESMAGIYRYLSQLRTSMQVVGVRDRIAGILGFVPQPENTRYLAEDPVREVDWVEIYSIVTGRELPWMKHNMGSLTVSNVAELLLLPYESADHEITAAVTVLHESYVNKYGQGHLHIEEFYNRIGLEEDQTLQPFITVEATMQQLKADVVKYLKARDTHMHSDHLIQVIERENGKDVEGLPANLFVPHSVWSFLINQYAEYALPRPNPNLGYTIDYLTVYQIAELLLIWTDPALRPYMDGDNICALIESKARYYHQARTFTFNTIQHGYLKLVS